MPGVRNASSGGNQLIAILVLPKASSSSRFFIRGREGRVVDTMHYNKMYVHNASFPENAICPVHPTLTAAAVVAQSRHFHHARLLAVRLVDLLDHLAGFLFGHLGFRHVGSCLIGPANWIEIRTVTDEKQKGL